MELTQIPIVPYGAFQNHSSVFVNFICIPKLPDLANKSIEHPVTFQFQTNNNF